MPLAETLLTLLCLLGALQGLLLGVAIGTLTEGPRRANRVLSLILLSSASVLVVVLLSHRTGAGAASALELVEYSMWFFAGPLAYLYVSLATTADSAPPRPLLPHLAPGVAWLVYLALFYSGATGSAVPWLPPVVWMMLYQMLYTALAVWRWRRAAAGGPPVGIHAMWVPVLIVVLLIQHAAQLVRWQWSSVEQLRDIVPLVGAASFVGITFLGLRRALPLLGKARRRYAGSTLGGERAREVAARLTAVLERDRPYLRPELLLDELAAELGVPKTHLSQVVNEHFGRSFPELLGRYRVRESERLLSDERLAHLTIEAIARRSGFNSRSVFYEAFRRRHGVTPSEFRRRSSRPLAAGTAGADS